MQGAAAVVSLQPGAAAFRAVADTAVAAAASATVSNTAALRAPSPPVLHIRRFSGVANEDGGAFYKCGVRCKSSSISGSTSCRCGCAAHPALRALHIQAGRRCLRLSGRYMHGHPRDAAVSLHNVEHHWSTLAAASLPLCHKQGSPAHHRSTPASHLQGNSVPARKFCPPSTHSLTHPIAHLQACC